MTRILVYLDGGQTRQERERERLRAVCDRLRDRIDLDGTSLYPTRPDHDEEESGERPSILLASVLEQKFDEPSEGELPLAIAAALRSFAEELTTAAERLEGGAA